MWIIADFSLLSPYGRELLKLQYQHKTHQFPGRPDRSEWTLNNVILCLYELAVLRAGWSNCLAGRGKVIRRDQAGATHQHYSVTPSWQDRVSQVKFKYKQLSQELPLTGLSLKLDWTLRAFALETDHSPIFKSCNAVQLKTLSKSYILKDSNIVGMGMGM